MDMVENILWSRNFLLFWNTCVPRWWDSCCSIFSFLCNILPLCPFFCVVCPSIYGVWLTLWHLQTFLVL